jgi:biopolymer transport protein ExbD
MAEKRRFLDVWIVESNTVYREVPYTVVADWVQQGRLLEDDMLRPSGTADWFKVGALPAFAAYLPKTEPFRAEDQAEALEPVQVDFSWKKSHDDDDDDVDMIPLIDVSLVLLVFFMLTAAGAAVGGLIPTPLTDNVKDLISPDSNSVAIGINLDGPEDDRFPVYSLSVANKPADPRDADLRSREELLTRLDELLAKKDGPVEVTINAHKDVQAGLVRQLAVDLEKPQRKFRIRSKFIGVRERVP